MKSQILFSVCVFGLSVYTLSDRFLAHWLKRTFLCMLAFVAVLIWWPTLSTRAANLLGIGRGVDLLIYLALFGVVFALLSTHIRIRRLEALVTHLARNIALQSVDKPEPPVKDEAVPG